MELKLVAYLSMVLWAHYVLLTTVNCLWVLVDVCVGAIRSVTSLVGLLLYEDMHIDFSSRVNMSTKNVKQCVYVLWTY